MVPYVKTDDNMADFFTKPLPAKRFFVLRNKIMNVPHPVTPDVADCGACGDTGVVKGEPCDLCPRGDTKIATDPAVKANAPVMMRTCLASRGGVVNHALAPVHVA